MEMRGICDCRSAARFTGLSAQRLLGPPLTAGVEVCDNLPPAARFTGLTNEIGLDHPLAGDPSMSRNYYSEINLHIVWHNKLSAPLLASAVETEVHKYVKFRIIQTPGLFV